MNSSDDPTRIHNPRHRDSVGSNSPDPDSSDLNFAEPNQVGSDEWVDSADQQESQQKNSDQKNPDLLLEQVVAEFTDRIRNGETPEIQVYLDRFPQIAEELDDVLPSIAMIEELKSHSTRSSQSSSDSRADIEIPDYLGEYRIIKEVGRGGMGVVVEAVHETLGRRVAIKIMTPGSRHPQQYLDRFHREAIAAASLHHTNIVNVFGTGEDKGYHFYVMEFVDGVSINQVLKEEKEGTDATGAPRSTMREADRFKWIAGRCMQIADALQYAHEKQILHRDIKPSNLVLDGNGTLWLTDFGLAKQLGEQALTKTGDIIGTPQYMAPESFSGRYDHRSETYCLGLTLYEMSTLKPAFANGPPAQVIQSVTTTSPVSSKKMAPEMPGDLSIIIDKAIARDPDQRYQTAGTLRDDLRAFIEDRPISAKKMSVLAHAVRLYRRNRLAAVLGGVAVLMMVLLTVTAISGYLITRQALSDTKAEQQATQDALQLAEANAEKFERQYQRAESSVQRAESNVEVAMQAFDDVFEKFIRRGADWQNRSGIEGFEQIVGVETTIAPEDAEFVEKLLNFYQQLAQQNDESVESTIQSANVNYRAALILKLLGRQQEAVEHFQTSTDRYLDLCERFPSHVDYVANAVAARNELATLSIARGRLRQGTLALVQSKQQLQQHGSADDPQLQLALIKTINRITSGYVRFILATAIRDFRRIPFVGLDLESAPVNGQLRTIPMEQTISQVVKMAGQAVVLAESLHQQQPEDPAVRVVREESYCQLALLENQGGGSKGQNTLVAAISELSALAIVAPDEPKYRYLLAMTQTIASRGQSSEQAIETVAAAEELARQLVDEFPERDDYHQLYVSVASELGVRLLESEQWGEAAEMVFESCNTLVYLKSRMPRDFGTFIAHRKISRLLQMLGDVLTGPEFLEQAVEAEGWLNRLQFGSPSGV